jgi:hypothetical protein
MEKIYVDYAGGHFEAWTYADGQTVRFHSLRTLPAIREYARKHHYTLVLTDEAKLFA